MMNSLPDVVDLTSDEEVKEADEKKVILESIVIPNIRKCPEAYDTETIDTQKAKEAICLQPSYAIGSFGSECFPLGQARIESDACETASVPTESSHLICRQFWKAGTYHVDKASKIKLNNGGNHMRVHPKFLHSNATSHKWALGAIAELLDNAMDEVQNGATFVSIDKVVNPRDQSPALLIQDDGGGMDPECIRHCMSLGYSEKKKSAIGQYGNGFKTSTMRLGSDVVVFTSCQKSEICTQSIGLLSYTFLTKTGHEDTIVPMIDYELSPTTGKRNPIIRTTMTAWSHNMSTILQWSPYQSETDLLKQFDDIGHHGTKVVVYNLWLNDEGEMELDFENDLEDIQISGAPKVVNTVSNIKTLQQMHVANRFRYSLRVYASILYLQMPKGFSILLRGRAVEHYSIIDGLKYPQYILYRPLIGENKQAAVITTIGFLKEAPHISVHGFNVYHKNRLILPFWRVLSEASSRGRGVVGVLEANFIEPAHDKQDFEKTVVLQKLEGRLKEMTLEYWTLHCGLIGYKAHKSPSVTLPFHDTTKNTKSVMVEPIIPTTCAENLKQYVHPSATKQDANLKRKAQSDFLIGEIPSKRQAVLGQGEVSDDSRANQVSIHVQDSRRLQEARELLEENERLREQCKEYEKVEEELKLQVQQLEKELQEVESRVTKLLMEAPKESRVKRES